MGLRGCDHRRTYRRHGVNPDDELRDVPIRIEFQLDSRLDELLPMHWKPPDESGEDGEDGEAQGDGSDD